MEQINNSLSELIVWRWRAKKNGLSFVECWINYPENNSSERIQKTALAIILGVRYTTYTDAISTLNVETQESRRTKLWLKFGLNTLGIPKLSRSGLPQISLMSTLGMHNCH